MGTAPALAMKSAAENVYSRAGEMAPWVKAPAAKPKTPEFDPWDTHIGNPSNLSSDLHTHAVAHTCPLPK